MYLLLLTVFLYSVWVMMLYLTQRSMLFPGSAFPSSTELERGVGRGEQWWLSTRGGEVEAWYYRSESGGTSPGPAIIFAHGNGEQLDDWEGAFDSLLALGVGVLLLEYPGYGRSEGVPTQRSITEVAVRAFDRLVALPEVDPARVIGLGRSLGGGVVCSLAREREIAALVLQSAFTRTAAFAGRFLFPKLLVRDPFDNLQVMRQFLGPVLVVHGTEDEVVPYRHGQRLSAAASRGTLVSYPCAHNDCPPSWPAFLELIVGFLRREGVLAGGGEP